MKHLRQSLASILRKWAFALNPQDALIDKHPRTQNESDQKRPEARHAQPIIRTIIDIPEPVFKEYRRNQQQQHGDNESNRSVAKWAVCVAAIYAAIAAFQWHEMRGSVEQQVLINRPVLLNDGMKSLDPKDVYPTKIEVTIFDFGKTVGVNATPFGHLEVGEGQ